MPQAQPARLAEVLAAPSLATDLGAAWPPETALKTCLVGVELARRVGLAEPEVVDVYFLALLRSVACTSFAHEMTRAWGDDIQARRLLDPVDKADPDGLLSVARALEQGQDRERGARPPPTCSRPPAWPSPTRCAWPIGTSAGASRPGWGSARRSGTGSTRCAADAYQALGQERPLRPALTAPEATRELRAAVAAGRIDGDAAGAVLVAAGERPARVRRAWPRGLTDREVEVLRLVARGRTARQVAAELVISVPTANHHIEHIYGKVGVSSRAGAALFAVEHGLLDP